MRSRIVVAAGVCLIVCLVLCALMAWRRGREIDRLEGQLIEVRQARQAAESRLAAATATTARTQTVHDQVVQRETPRRQQLEMEMPELRRQDRTLAETLEGLPPAPDVPIARACLDLVTVRAAEIINLDQQSESLTTELRAERDLSQALRVECAACGELVAAQRREIDLQRAEVAALKSRGRWGTAKRWLVRGGLIAAGVLSGKEEGYAFAAGVGSESLLELAF